MNKSGGNYCVDRCSRSTQTDQVKSKVLNVSLLILKSGEFDELAVKVVKKKNNKESVVITYSNLFGVLGEELDPVSITLSCDGVCRVHVLFCSVLSLHLVKKGTFDAGSFLSILRKYQKNTVFCPGIQSSIIPILSNKLLEELIHYEHPFQRHQARNCQVFYPKFVDISNKKVHCKDCKLFLVKCTSILSSGSKSKSSFGISENIRDFDEHEGKLQKHSDVFGCKNLVKSIDEMKDKVNDVNSEPDKLSEEQFTVECTQKSNSADGALRMIQSKSTDTRNGHAATKQSEACSLARKDQSVTFVDSDKFCTSKRLDEIIFHLEKAVTKSKKRTSLQPVNKSHTRYQNLAKLSTVRKWKLNPVITSSQQNFNPRFMKGMSTLSSPGEMPSIRRKTDEKLPSTGTTLQIQPVTKTLAIQPTTENPNLSVSTNNSSGKTSGNKKRKSVFSVEPVYKVSFPNAEGRNVCIQHMMSTKSLPQDHDIQSESHTSMSCSGHRADQVQVKALVDLANHHPSFATGKVQESRGRRKGLAAAQCPVCREYYSSERTLKRHLRIHNLVRPYSCPVCGKAFVQKITMKVHMRLHSGEKPHQCFICARSFAQKSNMETHVRRHLGVRPFKCEQCNKCFSDRGSLGEHKKTHTGEQPYLCTVCGKCFSQRANMRTHMNRHHAVKMHSCEKCSKTFKSKESLKKHMRYSHIKNEHTLS